MDALNTTGREAYRIKITSWTSSFRYPNIISGYQPTLYVPPLSTVLGLINAAAGRYVEHQSLELAYFFDYAAEAVDVETLWMVAGASRKGKAGEPDKMVATNNVKSNAGRRQFLFETTLYLYLFDKELADCFRQPAYQLLLGRSSDLATVEEVAEVELKPVQGKAHLKGQVVPVKSNFLPGVIQALPQYFTNTLPRQNIGTQAYSILNFKEPMIEAAIAAMTDTELKQKAQAEEKRFVGRKVEVPDLFVHQLQLA